MQLKPGDLIGFSGDGWLSALINVGTFGIPFWSLSHVGILAEHEGELLLFESTTLTDLPCVIQGKPVKGTQAHRLEDRLATYRGKAWHYPLYRPLYGHELARLNTTLLANIGKPYDEVDAFRARGMGYTWFERQFRETDMHALFCSEWCAFEHSVIGILPTDAPPRWNPNRLVRHERRLGVLLYPTRLK